MSLEGSRYEWQSGHGRRVPAQVVGETVAALEAAHGTCEAHHLVDEARSESSPLHPLFEWDDAVAAETYRVEQARRVLRTITVVEPTRHRLVPAFVHVQKVDGNGVQNGYQSISVAMADAGSRQFVLMDAMRQLRGLETRYRYLTELAPVWDSINVAVDEVTGKDTPVE